MKLVIDNNKCILACGTNIIEFDKYFRIDDSSTLFKTPGMTVHDVDSVPENMSFNGEFILNNNVIESNPNYVSGTEIAIDKLRTSLLMSAEDEFKNILSKGVELEPAEGSLPDKLKMCCTIEDHAKLAFELDLKRSKNLNDFILVDVDDNVYNVNEAIYVKVFGMIKDHIYSMYGRKQLFISNIKSASTLEELNNVSF